MDIYQFFQNAACDAHDSRASASSLQALANRVAKQVGVTAPVVTSYADTIGFINRQWRAAAARGQNRPVRGAETREYASITHRG